MVNFRFRLYTVPDNVYGVRDSETGEWNGIVRQLMDRRADIAVASMTINYARETVIDFTKPFMNLGISILFKVRVEIIIVVNLTCLKMKIYNLSSIINYSSYVFSFAQAPENTVTGLFSFMNPLDMEIWLYILIAYVLVSITIWIVARFSPYEWAHPHPCEDMGGLVYENDFTLPNSFWFAIGTLMQQG